MKKVFSKLRRHAQKLSFFDTLMVGLFFVVAVTTFTFFFRKTSYVTVRVRVTDRDVIWVYYNPPSWFVYLFKEGMKEKNFLGTTTAEITDVYYYDSFTQTNEVINKKTVYLTIRLRANYNKRTGEYKYNGIAVSAGEALKINFGNILVNGLITEVEGLSSSYETVYPVLKAQIKDNNAVFLGTTGVDQTTADALTAGDKVLDSNGNVAAEILKKEVFPAKTVTFDTFGAPHEYPHPRKKDIYLTVRVAAKKIGDELYYFDDFLVKIGAWIPLNFPKINVTAQITEIAL